MVNIKGPTKTHLKQPAAPWRRSNDDAITAGSKVEPKVKGGVVSWPCSWLFIQELLLFVQLQADILSSVWTVI